MSDIGVGGHSYGQNPVRGGSTGDWGGIGDGIEVPCTLPASSAFTPQKQQFSNTTQVKEAKPEQATQQRQADPSTIDSMLPVPCTGASAADQQHQKTAEIARCNLLSAASRSGARQVAAAADAHQEIVSGSAMHAETARVRVNLGDEGQRAAAEQQQKTAGIARRNSRSAASSSDPRQVAAAADAHQETVSGSAMHAETARVRVNLEDEGQRAAAEQQPRTAMTARCASVAAPSRGQRRAAAAADTHPETVSGSAMHAETVRGHVDLGGEGRRAAAEQPPKTAMIARCASPAAPRSGPRQVVAAADAHPETASGSAMHAEQVRARGNPGDEGQRAAAERQRKPAEVARCNLSSAPPCNDSRQVVAAAAANPGAVSGSAMHAETAPGGGTSEAEGSARARRPPTSPPCARTPHSCQFWRRARGRNRPCPAATAQRVAAASWRRRRRRQ